MTDTHSRASADAMFRPAVTVTPETRADGMSEYKARQQATLDNMERR
jgi:hypothetical protein